LGLKNPRAIPKRVKHEISAIHAMSFSTRLLFGGMSYCLRIDSVVLKLFGNVQINKEIRMPYNHVITLEKKSGAEQSEGIAFEDIDFEDNDLVAIHVLTPASIYRLNIEESGMDLRETDEKRREILKLVKGGKKEGIG
jgi:hypothetical protein